MQLQFSTFLINVRKVKTIATALTFHSQNNPKMALFFVNNSELTGIHYSDVSACNNNNVTNSSEKKTIT